MSVGDLVYQYIQRTSKHWKWPDPGKDPFDELALEVYQHQYNNNESYRLFHEAQQLPHGEIHSWRDIYPVATEAFKVAHLSTVPLKDAEAVFRTSGTTHGHRGRHALAELRYYQLGMVEPFNRHFRPLNESVQMLRFTPPTRKDSSSSLGFMVDSMATAWGQSDGPNYQVDGKLDLERAWNDLKTAEKQENPVFLLGAAFAYVHLLDYDPKLRVKLPIGSRLLETGGFKGQSREIPRDELRASLCDRLGLQPSHIVGEYGMTELSSQMYETGLRSTVMGEEGRPGYFAPPWLKVIVADPETMKPVADGQVGVIRFFDLANVNSVSSIVTGDLGQILPGGGLHVIGRQKDSELRGCSLQVESMG